MFKQSLEHFEKVSEMASNAHLKNAKITGGSNF
jgi:hypothetical protein